MDVDELLAEGRKIWGDKKFSLEEISILLGVVTGDIHRITREYQESGELDEEELKKELGNIIFSTIRWCDDLGYSVEECIKLAKQAQTDYKNKNYK